MTGEGLLNWARSVRGLGLLAEVGEVYFRRHLSRQAAGLAYFFVLTLFPALIGLSVFAAELDLESLLTEAEELLPAGVAEILAEYLVYLEEGHTPAVAAAGVTMTLLPASAAVRLLMHTLGEVYGRESLRGWRQIARSVAVSLLILSAVYLSVAAMVTGEWFLRAVGRLFGLSELAERLMPWQWVKYLLLLSAAFGLIFLLYRGTGPMGSPRLPAVPGALGAALALVGASLVFSAVMEGSARYSLVYGSLASVILLLVWLYLCGNILLIGGTMNFVWQERKNRR